MSAPVAVRAMRNFRLRHSVSLKELSEFSGKSAQWFNQMELGKSSACTRNQYYVMLAYQMVIDARKRKLAQMETEYKRMKHGFFEEVPEWELP